MAATLNALIYPSAPGVIAERRMIDTATIPAHKAAWWRPVVVVGNDAFDPATQKKTGPVTTIEPNRVVDTYSVVSLTAQELSDIKDAKVSSVDRVAGAMIWELANEVRALKSPPQPALTKAQFLAWAKSKIGDL